MMPSMINKQAVDALCDVVGLSPDAVRHLTIDVELPGIITVNAQFYLLPKQEPTPTQPEPKVRRQTQRKGNR